MTGLDHDVRPVLVQLPRGQVVRGGVAIATNEVAGEIEGREQPEPSWYPAALLRGAS